MSIEIKLGLLILIHIISSWVHSQLLLFCYYYFLKEPYWLAHQQFLGNVGHAPNRSTSHWALGFQIRKHMYSPRVHFFLQILQILLFLLFDLWVIF